MMPQEVRYYVEILADLGAQQMMYKTMADPDGLVEVCEDPDSDWTMIQNDEEDWVAEYKNAKTGWMIDAVCDYKRLIVTVTGGADGPWTFFFSIKNECEVVSSGALGDDGQRLLKACQRSVDSEAKRKRIADANPGVNHNLIRMMF